MYLRRHRKEVIFLIDLFITTFISSILFFFLSETEGMVWEKLEILFPHLLLLIVCGTLSQYFFKSYDSLWRYAESKEYLILLIGGITGFTGYVIIDYLIFKSRLPILFSIAAYSLSLLIMLFMRFFYRLYRKHICLESSVEKIPIAIIGAGDAGVRLQEELKNNPNSKYKTVCFIDDSEEKIGKYIHNIEVKGPINHIEEIKSEKNFQEIIVAMPSAPQEKQKAILESCMHCGCHIRILPFTLALLQNHGHNSLWNTVQDVWLEEILGREQITFQGDEVRRFLNNKVIMVTGGGGSIGSEICRQVAKEQPKQLVIMDIYENNAYEIQQELLRGYKDQLDLKVEIASVRDSEKIDQLMKRYRPDIIFHAAAHKHVPLMEECPEEAIKNNILGTYHLVMAADRYKVDKFVLISTDKAVNPTSVMGASKRFCEMILQSMKQFSKTEFVAVRFGNVLGSNGSVIPLFQKQIADGGPVTITDKRIVRYFMTISEAVALVLQAGSMANSAEVYVLDMGQPVKIIELAENLIRLSGYIPDKDISIIETGLRPGEKLYEELLMQSEELIATANNKIFIERQKEISRTDLDEMLALLQRALESDSPEQIKDALKSVVTTYHNPEEVNDKV